MSNIFEDLEAGFIEKPNFVTPSFTTLVSKFQDANLQRVLISGYETDDASRRAATSVINAVFTQKLLVFVISKRVVEALIKADSNFKKGQRPSLGNKGVYAGMLAFLLRKGFRVEVEGESFRPTIVAVDNQGWIDYISKELTQDWKVAQYNACLAYVANIDPNTGINTSLNTRVNTESPSPLVSKTPSRQDTYSPKGETGEDVVQSSVEQVLLRKKKKGNPTSTPVGKDKATQKNLKEVSPVSPIAVAQTNPSMNSVFSSWVSKTGILKANKSQEDFYSRRLPDLRLLMAMLGEHGYTQIDLPVDLEKRATNFWLPAGHHPQAKELTSKDWNMAIQLLPEF
jgi:hypothetical protein